MQRLVERSACKKCNSCCTQPFRVHSASVFVSSQGNVHPLFKFYHPIREAIEAEQKRTRGGVVGGACSCWLRLLFTFVLLLSDCGPCNSTFGRRLWLSFVVSWVDWPAVFICFTLFAHSQFIPVFLLHTTIKLRTRTSIYRAHVPPSRRYCCYRPQRPVCAHAAA